MITVLNQENLGLLKICRKCLVTKNQDDFYFAKHGKLGRRSQCKDCDSNYYRTLNPEIIKQRNIESRSRSLEKDPEARRWEAIKRKYRLSKQDWLLLFEKQGKVCAICSGIDPKGINWHTDHCHESQRVRGILCANCNQLLGKLGDSKSSILTWLNKCLDYVSKD